MILSLEKGKILEAVKLERNPFIRHSSFLKKVFLFLFGVTFLLFLESFWKEIVSSERLFGLSLIFITFGITFWLLEKFFELKLKNPEPEVSIKEVVREPEKYNLAQVLSFEVAKAVYQSLKYARVSRKRGDEFKAPKVSSNHLFYFLLKNPELEFIFSRAVLNVEQIRSLLKSNLEAIGTSSVWWTPDFERTLLKALKLAYKKKHNKIKKEEVLVALAEHNKIFKEILVNNELKVDDIKNLAWWEERLLEKEKFWEYEHLAKKGTIARAWAAGYTVTLDKYSTDLISKVRKERFREIIGHQDQIKRMERILSRSEINNVLVVGQPGTGRKSMVEALAKKSFLGESLPEVNDKRVVELSMSTLLAQIESFEKVESTLETIFQEVASAGNVILVINEFHNYVGPGTKPGAIDITGLLSKYLRLSQFQVIGICSFAGLHKNIEQNPSLLKLFEKVEVPEISEQETIKLLENFALGLEHKYHKFISYPALRDIVFLSSKYLPGIPFPKKALDLLDEIMVYVAGLEEPAVLPKHVAKVVSEKSEIPVGKIKREEKKVLLELERLIHKRIIDQDLAVKEVCSALRRARTGITIRKGPLGGFLFLGPTGVGKTETSKALTAIYFGSESRMIRLDMSEFQNIKDVPRLIGSSEEQGLLTTAVRENPFSLVLLDEIEKAHPKILNLFLQVLDEGFITDGLGRKISFKNAMIIATSNAGAEIIWEDVKKDKKMDLIKEDLLDYLFKEKIFSPEFINRFDEVVLFKPLTKQNLLDIAQLLLRDLVKNLEKKDIQFVITPELKKKIVELGYSPAFGAREMRRVIQDKIENPLAKALLEEKLKRGAKVKINPETFEIITLD